MIVQKKKSIIISVEREESENEKHKISHQHHIHSFKWQRSRYQSKKETSKTATSWQIQIRRLWGESFYSHQQCGAERRMKKWEALSVSNKFLLRLSFKSLVNTFSFFYSDIALCKASQIWNFTSWRRRKSPIIGFSCKKFILPATFFPSAHIFRLILSLDFLHALYVGGYYANYTLNSRHFSSFSAAVRTTLSRAHSNSLAISHRLCHQIYFWRWKYFNDELKWTVASRVPRCQPDWDRIW